MPYREAALLSVTLFALAHLLAQRLRVQARFLSAGGGIAIAYVFVDLLPKLAKSDLLVKQALEGIFPYFERHVYVMALTGFLLFFTVGQSHTFLPRRGRFWLSLGSYALFNFLIGYAVVDRENPEVQPLALFTFAIALHYFVNDYTLCHEHPQDYRMQEKWLLVASLYLGWLAGFFVLIPPTAIALVSAFIGGGVIMNVTRHELPSDRPHSLGAFLAGALLYTSLLLAIG